LDVSRASLLAFEEWMERCGAEEDLTAEKPDKYGFSQVSKVTTNSGGDADGVYP
jgi:hypothetical protein